MLTERLKALRNWRVVAAEIAIIVVGVLIALTAEQIVQDWEWRDKVRTAEQAMQRELFLDNAPQVYQRATIHPCLQRKLAEIRDAAHNGKDRRELSDLISGVHLQVVSYDSFAIEAAFASDVAAHMPQERLNAYIDAYAVIPFLDRTNTLEAADLARLRSLRRHGGPLSEAEASRVLEAVESLRNHDEMIFSAIRWGLPALRRLGGEIDPVRKQGFMNFARHHYGTCIKDLPQDWAPKSPFHPVNYRPGRPISDR